MVDLTAAQFTSHVRDYAVGVAYRIMRDSDLAEDLAHDALAKAWAGRARFAGRVFPGLTPADVISCLEDPRG